MIISVTEIETFLRCRRKWDLSSLNRQSLSPIVNAAALVVGGLVHATLAWWRENPTGDPVKKYKELAATELIHTIQLYTENVGVPPTQEELQSIADGIDVGQEMIANYVKVWKQPIPDEYQFISNEQTILVSIPNTLHCECELHFSHSCDLQCSLCQTSGGSCACQDRDCACLKPHYLEATLDGLLLGPKGNHFILECKTYAKTPNDKELNHKFQFVAYMWALRQTGIECRAMLYDGLFKSDHQRRGHTLEDNFLRKLLVRREAEIQEFERDLAHIAKEMASPHLVLYKHVPPVGGCFDCRYQELCDAMSRGEDVNDASSRYIRFDYKQWHKSEVWQAAIRDAT